MNARIEEAFLGVGEHGLLTVSLRLLVSGGSYQSFGNFKLGTLHRPSSLLGFVLGRIIEVVGVTEWSELLGQPVRIECQDGAIHRLGHFLDEYWFDFAAELREISNRPVLINPH